MRHSVCRKPFVFFTLLPLLITLVPRTFAFAAQENGTEAENSAENVEAQGIGLNVDRKTISTLSALRQSLRAGNAEAVVDDFRRLQTAAPDTMVPSTRRGTFQPLYRVLFRTFRELPAVAQNRLSQENADFADNWLREILAEQQPEKIPSLIQKMPGTNAALQGHLVLARIHVARGNRAAARAWLVPLLSREIPETYRSIAEQAIQSLTENLLENQASSDNANDEIPSHVHWQFRPEMSPNLKSQITVLQGAVHEAGMVPESTWEDVVASDVVFRRTMRCVAAVDTANGSTLWQYPMNTDLDKRASNDQKSNGAFHGANGLVNKSTQFNLVQQSTVANAFCRDNVIGKISGDEARLYFISAETRTSVQNPVNGAFISSNTKPTAKSRLIALERSTGRRVWSLASESMREIVGTDSASCWFFGIPAKGSQSLYTVFEWEGEIRLACVKCDTGEVSWTTVLAFPAQAIQNDPVRQRWTATPEFSEGLIWCPTTTGWTTCVDAVTRTALWASYTESTAPPLGTTSVRRGRPVAITPQTALSQRWPIARLVRLNDRLILCPHESHRIVLLDAFTGTLVREQPVAAGAIVVHIDNENIIYAEPAQQSERQSDGSASVVKTKSVLKCLDSQSGGRKWRQSLTAEQGLPTGAGVLRNGRLILPMSTGHLAVVDPNVGVASLSEEAVVPVHGWGHLATLPASDEILYSAPDTLLKLSAKERHDPPEDPLEFATALMAARKWNAALELLSELPDSPTQQRKIDDLRFECYRQLATLDPAQHLMSLKNVATTPQQKTEALLLQASWNLHQQKDHAAFTDLTELLKLDSVQRAKMMGPLTLRYFDDHDPVEGPQVSVSLQTAVCRELTGLLRRITQNNVADKKVVDTDLFQDVPTECLLHIYHDSIRPILIKRISADTANETALHLIRHSVSLARNEDDSYSDLGEEAVAFASIFKLASEATADEDNRSTVDSAVFNMLKVVAIDFPKPFRDEVTDRISKDGLVLPDRTALDIEFRRSLKEHFESWDASEYSAMPVLRNTSIGRIQSGLTPATGHDPFLRMHHWSATRSDFGRLHASNVAKPDQRWSIPGVFDVYGVYSNRTDVLRRQDSVLLLQTYRGLAAISVLDQKVLWSRQMTSRSSSVFASATGFNFTEFVPSRDQLPSNQTMSLVKFVGSGERWVCVKHGTALQTIDTFTGETIWSVDVPSRFRHIVATNDLVAIADVGKKEILCFRRDNGEPMNIDGLSDIAFRVIRSYGSKIVCWRDNGKDASSLEWIDPLSGVVQSERTLSRMKYFQFLDDDNLVGFNDRNEMLVVNLQTGVSKECSFAVEGVEPTFRQKSLAPEMKGVPHLWSALRLQVDSDGLQYYLTNRNVQNSPPIRQPSGRQMTNFYGGVRAVDMATGKLAWSLAGEEPLLATSDQPELPLLILIASKVVTDEKAAATGMQNVFRGITRLGGREVFQQPVASKYGLRYMSIDSARPDSVDIGVYGRRVRLTGQAVGQRP